MDKYGAWKDQDVFFVAEEDMLSDESAEISYCGNCGHKFETDLFFCEKCGCGRGMGVRYCTACGARRDPAVQLCMQCGRSLSDDCTRHRSRIKAGLLAMFLGGLGAHSFYLGNFRKGCLQLLVTLATFGLGHLWGFVEGVMILSDYIDRDARGVPLD